MKLLSSIQELWEYCEFCPICQKGSRHVYISVGPEFRLKLDSHLKTKDNLVLFCQIRLSKKEFISVNYHIKCADNSIDIEMSDQDKFLLNEKVNDWQGLLNSLYFYLRGDCSLCNSTQVHTLDVEMISDLLPMRNMGIERESLYISDEDDKFHISLMYDRNAMLVSRCFKDPNDPDITLDSKSVEVPLVNLDFTNSHKVINKVKTLILFS